ncbi:MAG TPA: complex I NDUFA9 subunit family protein [Rhizomicrobium sp.]|jgi:NADH dehydrogenase|nr:complex I NDUFA9 subunit family protein [Rhizomicrobium sp.]
MTKPLVTVFGGSGFLGRNAVRALAKAGHRIRVAVRYPNLANYLLPMGAVGQIQIAKTDVRDDAQVAAALRGADAAVNLVGILYNGGGQNFDGVHVEAAERMARAAKAAGAQRFVHVSSTGVDEDSDSNYARTKAQGEARVRAEFPSATILRPSLVFGPEDNFFNRFAGLARISPVLPLIGGGHTKFQPVFVGDVADAILRGVEDSAIAGKIYELGGPGIYTFKQLMQIVLRETGRTRLLVPLPFFAAALQSYVLGLLPNPLLTPDQVRLLKTDSVVSPGALTLADLGIQPDSLEAIVPSYLWRFRAKGQFEEIAP